MGSALNQVDWVPAVDELYYELNHISFDDSKNTLMLAQRPITLVLMMINSCSYSTNDLVFNKFQILYQDLSRYLVLTKDSKSSFEDNTC